MGSSTSSKQLLKDIFDINRFRRVILFSAIPATLFYSFSLIKLRSEGFSIIEILRDAAQQSGQSSFLGFISTIGIWLWVSSAAICLFTVMVGGQVYRIKYKGLLLLTGALSIILAADDFFLIHERYYTEENFFLIYAVFAGIIFIRYYKTIIEVDGLAFMLAGLFLASSILIDMIQFQIPMSYEYTQVFEEGMKFVGITTWLYFNCRVALCELSLSAME